MDSTAPLRLFITTKELQKLVIAGEWTVNIHYKITKEIFYGGLICSGVTPAVAIRAHRVGVAYKISTCGLVSIKYRESWSCDNDNPKSLRRYDQRYTLMSGIPQSIILIRDDFYHGGVEGGGVLKCHKFFSDIDYNKLSPPVWA